MMTIAARLAKLDTSAMAQAGKAAPLAVNILNYAQQTSRRLSPVTRFAGNFVPGLGLVADGMDALADTGLSGREKPRLSYGLTLKIKLPDWASALSL